MRNQTANDECYLEYTIVLKRINEHNVIDIDFLSIITMKSKSHNVLLQQHYDKTYMYMRIDSVPIRLELATYEC